MHPDDKLTGEINPEKITHKINKTWMQDNEMHGEIELIPESIPGKIMHSLVDKYGAVPGISSRAFGKMNGNYVDHPTYKYVTHDLTFNPSTPGAFLEQVKESQEFMDLINECDEHELQVLKESFESWGGKVDINILNERNDGKDGKTPPDEDDNDESKKMTELENKYKELSEASGDKEEYQKKFNKILKKWGLKDLAALKKKSADEQKKFCDEVDAAHTSDEEESGKSESNNQSKSKLTMEEMEKLTEQISSLSEELGTVKKQNESLEEAASKFEETEKELKETIEKLEEHYEKSLKVVEGLIAKTLSAKSEAYENNKLYEKAVAVANSLKEQLEETSKHYNKSVRVLEEYRGTTVASNIQEMVAKELGNFEPYKEAFQGIDDIEKAKAVVEAIKLGKGAKPTDPKLTENEKVDENGNPINEDNSSISEDGRDRVSIYS